jgi:tetratricopeptide (TPR) repeat protein
MARVSGSLRGALALLAISFMLCTSRPAVASSALELVRIARAHEAAREDDLALRRYTEALALDPTCAEAYLGLAKLRTRHGDLREAERVYNVALEHLPALRAARIGRAYVRRALGARTEAIDDLLTGAEDDPASLRVLASWYGEEGQTPAQLAVWRRIAARAEATQDTVLLHEARTTVRALVILVGPADPAAFTAADDKSVRRFLATLARKGV